MNAPRSLVLFVLSLPCLLAASPAALHDPKSLPDTDPAPYAILKVFTPTGDEDDGRIHYYPHTSYTVERTDGVVVKRVSNHISRDDEDPTLVNLPAGDYILMVQSALSFKTRIPVSLHSGKLLLVYLENDWKKEMKDLPNAKPIRTSRGTVGWTLEVGSHRTTK